ncbi:MAG TPA: hypothetical protein VGA00_03105 [Acidiferrobacterales bacterium]|jgi:hypothetical protein
MVCLERAAEEIITQWTASRQKDRETVLTQMNKAIDCCNEAVQIWEGFLKSPGSGADKFSVLPAVGAARAKQLHEISLKAFDVLEQACRLTTAGRFLALDESLIETAYRLPKPGETAPDYARAAIVTMQQRIAKIRELMARIKNAKPVAAKAAPKQAAPKQAAPRKAVKKSPGKTAKQAAKPKAAVKKKAAKKSVKKAKRR